MYFKWPFPVRLVRVYSLFPVMSETCILLFQIKPHATLCFIIILLAVTKQLCLKLPLAEQINDRRMWLNFY